MKNIMIQTNCPACDSSSIKNKGQLPCVNIITPPEEGGLGISFGIDPANLLFCRNCGLFYRDPHFDAQQLQELYRYLPASTWEEPHPPQWWVYVKDSIAQYAPVRSVVDVGCFRGDFLAYLGENWKKYGIEPNRAASEIARQRGVEIIGETPGDSITSLTMGAVVIMDVLEHMPDPMKELGLLRRMLAPGGCMVITTGATNTLSWRIFGRYYWYSAWAGHVCFYSLRWFRWMAKQLGMQLVWYKYYISKPEPLKIWAKQSTEISAYMIYHRLRDFGVPERLLKRIPQLGKVAHWKSIPWWSATRDQIAVVLK